MIDIKADDQYTGEDTLDEPISKTIVCDIANYRFIEVLTVEMRDLRSIYAKLLQVLYPPKQGSNELLRCVFDESSHDCHSQLRLTL